MQGESQGFDSSALRQFDLHMALFQRFLRCSNRYLSVMANENVVVNDPAVVAKKFATDLADRDARIKALESELKGLNEKHSAQKKRADRAEAQAKDLQSRSESPPAKGIVVYIDGVAHPSIGQFRADNTFADVKRGYCPEGVMLVAIDRPG